MPCSQPGPARTVFVKPYQPPPPAPTGLRYTLQKLDEHTYNWVTWYSGSNTSYRTPTLYCGDYPTSGPFTVRVRAENQAGASPWTQRTLYTEPCPEPCAPPVQPPNPYASPRLVRDPCGATNFYQVKAYFEPLGYLVCWNETTAIARICHPTCLCTVNYWKYDSPDKVHMCPRDNRMYVPYWRLTEGLQRLKDCIYRCSNSCTEGGFTCE